MHEIIMEIDSIEIYASLNNTLAANDFFTRLPLTFTCIDSGIDYCCEYSLGKYTIDEMQRGWKNGDIAWNGGLFSILYEAEKYSFGYNVMVIGHIKEVDLNLFKNFPKEITITFYAV